MIRFILNLFRRKPLPEPMEYSEPLAVSQIFWGNIYGEEQ